MAKEKFYLRNAQVLEHIDDQSKTPTTLTAAAAKGATSLTVAAITGIVNGATIRVGQGETAEWNIVNGAPSGVTVNLALPLGQAHAIGEATRPGITYDYGDPTDGGVAVVVDMQSTDINISTKRAVYTILNGYLSASASFARPGISAQQITKALGMLASRVTGSGTSSAPYNLFVDGSQIGEDINQGLTVSGLLADGTFKVFELHGCDSDFTGFKVQLQQGVLGSVPVKSIASSQLVIADAVPAYVVNSTLKPGRGSVFNLPAEFGIYSDVGGGMSSTLTADAAAGATAFTVASSTGAAVGDKVRFSSGDDLEVLEVLTVPDSTHITTKTPTFYPHVTGVAVVEQQQVPFGAPTEDGLSLSIGGSTKETAIATKRLKGVLPATVTQSLGFMLGDLILANIAYALGAPQTDVSGGRLIASANIGTSSITAFYMRGTLQGGGTLEVNAYANTQEIKSVSVTLSAKDVAKLPITLRPTLLQFRQF